MQYTSHDSIWIVFAWPLVFIQLKLKPIIPYPAVQGSNACPHGQPLVKQAKLSSEHDVGQWTLTVEYVLHVPELHSTLQHWHGPPRTQAYATCPLVSHHCNSAYPHRGYRGSTCSQAMRELRQWNDTWADG